MIKRKKKILVPKQRPAMARADASKRQSAEDSGRVWLPNSKFQKKNSTSAWRLKSKQNKKRIATAVCKWRDKSNEPSYAVIRC